MAYFETADGLSLYYSQSGPPEATPLLCLAGLTRCSRDFRYFLAQSPQYNIVTLDCRGRGQSDFDPIYTNYSVLQEAQDVIALLDHLALTQVAILGTSRGGLIAMMLAALDKSRLSGVILNDVGPDIPPNGLARILDYVGRRPAAKTLEQAAQQLKTAMAPAFPDVPDRRWLEEVSAFYDATDDGLALRYDPKLRDALIEQSQQGPVPDLWPLFMMLDGLPLGVLRGENSDILSAATLAEMKTRLPRIKARELKNRGHVPFLDEPEALDLIASVLNQI